MNMLRIFSDISISLLYISKIRMTDLQSLAQTHLSLLERYLLAQDSLAFLAKEVTLPQDRELFSLLLDPSTPKDKEFAKHFGLDRGEQENLALLKLWREVKKASTQEQKKDLLSKIKELHPDIKFDYAQPVEFTFNTQKEADKKEDTKVNNVLVTQETVTDVTLKALKENPQNFAKLSAYGLRNFPLKQAKTLNESAFGFFFSKPEVLRSFDPEELADFLAFFIEKAAAMKNTTEQQEFPEEFYRQLTVAQIQALKKKIPNLCKGYSNYRQEFKQKYEEKLSQYKPINELSFEEKQAKKNLCESIVETLEKENNEFSHYFIQKLTEEILLIEESIVDSNLKRFIKYLSNLKSVNYDNLESKFKESIKQKYGKNKFLEKTHSPLSYLDSSKISQNELINRTITSLFKTDQKDIIEALCGFISKKHLIKEQATVKLSKGAQKQIKNLYEIFTVAEINQMKDKKLLTFTDNSKGVYKINEKVQLEVKIKNIKSVTIKLFSVDLEKHYLQNGGEIDEQMNLKFLVPLKEKRQEYPQVDPFQENVVKIDMPELEKQLGMFIVELEGEGVTSRAIIRKGTIILKNKLTPVGHQLTFYDELGQQIDKLQLWRDNKRIEVDKSFNIPFGTQGSQSVIVVYKGYSQRESINILNEVYNLSVDYVYHSESFIVGHKAKIILRPSLSLQNEKMSLSRLSKPTLKITTTNNQQISNSTLHENIKLKDNQDYVLQIPVKSYISRVKIELQAQIQKIDKTKQNISDIKEIVIDLEENTNNFIDGYLQNSDGQFLLKVRGKNGEGIANVPASFSYEQFGADFSFSQSLTADENGVFVLGALKQVKKLTANISHNNFMCVRTWKINNFSQSISYGGPIFNNSYKLYLTEGQTLSLPLPCPLKPSDLVFYKEHSTLGTINNCIDDLQLSDTQLSVPKLTLGRFTLIFLRYDRRIDVQVIKAKKWIGNDLIDDKNTIYKIQKKPEYFALGELKTKLNQNEFECSIEILGPSTLPKDLRVHIFAKNYIDSDNSNIYSCSNPMTIPNNTEVLNIKRSSYYSDKSLSDETAYVLNRKKQEITAGNNLEKPHMFLKRIEVRDTVTKDQELRQEGMFEQKKMMHKGAMPQMNACYDAPRMYAAQAQAQYGGLLWGQGGRQFGRGPACTIQRNLNTHNNFLKVTGHLSSNVSALTSVKIPKGYSHIVVFLFSEDTTIKKEYSLPSSPQQTINMTHSALADSSEKQAWTMSREIYPLLSSQQKEISRTCTWTTVSKQNVIEYASTMGHKLPEWLSNWHLYTPEKQLQVYDKEFSHELNFFLYKNDKPFFEKVVKPFLGNRMKKTFIDLYLMESEEVLEYAQAHRLAKLNHFQKALLVERIRAFGKEEEAENLAAAMMLPLKNKKQSGEEFKRFFQTILNAKKIQQNMPPPPPPPGAPPGFDYGMFGAGGGGGGPPPQSYAMEAEECCAEADLCQYEDECCVDNNYEVQKFQKAQQQYKAGFKQTQKTREYTETTYEGVIRPEEYPILVPSSLFWAELAKHYSSKQAQNDFLSDKFWSFNTKREFVLACSILPSSQADYELGNSQGNHLVSSKSSFLIFAREVKALPYTESKSIVLNQRFFDPNQRYTYEQDGTQIQKIVQNFLTLKPYTVQTILTNISGSTLQVQLLIDIPQGSIPLKNHEQTQILNISINAYSTLTFQREFYFPAEGKYAIYPANASRNRVIIAKSSKMEPILVTKTEIITKKETLDNILKSGTNEQVYAFFSNKNIFDWNLFDYRLILWKLKDKQFYEKSIKIFKKRQYFQSEIWSFGLLHDDFQTTIQYFESFSCKGLELQTMDLPIFEYYPYYSSRVHKFANENKSTIRVKEFRETYSQFLLSTIFDQKIEDQEVKLALIYYLILQDRITEASKLFKKVPNCQRKQYQLQYDYVECFLDMYGGGETNYQKAREISEKYKEYPVTAWKKLFLDVYDTLTKSQELQTEEQAKTQEKTFNTTVINNGTEIKINRPAQTTVTVNFYKIDLELYFSEFPFLDIKNFKSTVTPTKTQQLKGSQFQVHTLIKNEYLELGDCVVEIYEQRQNAAPSKIDKFLWGNPEVKVKINENEGTLKVFFQNKKCPTSYCKVYSRGSKGDRFYRDGYTDIASTFRYALDQKDIREFSILVATDYGGILHRVKPPVLQ